MTRRKSDARRAEAVHLASKGLTTREVAATLRKKHRGEGFSEAWVRKVVAASDAAPPSEPPPSEPPPPAAPAAPVASAPSASPEDAESDDVLEMARRIAAEQRAVARDAKADGNHTAAQRALKQAGDAANLIARLEARRSGADDVVTIPRAELERARQAMHERVAALVDDLLRTGGVVCSHCGRELRIAIAKGETK